MSRYRRRGQDASLAAAGGAIGRSGPYRTAVGGARTGGRRILAAGAAPTAPAAPTLDSASPIPAGVALAWTSNGTGGSPITGYNVLRGTASGGETLLASGVATTSYADNTAVNGTKYYYTVEAVNAIGTSAQSNELAGNTLVKPVPIGTAATTSAVTDLALTTTVAGAVGDTVLLFVCGGSTAATSITASDSAGDAYTADIPVTATNTAILSAKLTAPLPVGSTITVHFGGGTNFGSVVADLVVGAKLTAAATQELGYTASPPFALAVNELADHLSYVGAASFGGGASGSVSAPWTSVNGKYNTDREILSAADLPTAAGTNTCTVSWGTTHGSDILTVQYAAA